MNLHEEEFIVEIPALLQLSFIGSSTEEIWKKGGEIIY